METVLPTWLTLLAAALLGACIGSFLTLVTYRLPRDEKIGATRSRCPSCRRSLRVRDLVPVFSWLAYRARCGQCGVNVSPRYPLTELACAVGTAALVYRYGIGLEALAILVLWWSTVAIVVTDLEHTIILDEVQIAVAASGVVWGLAAGVPYDDMLLGGGTGAAIGLALKYGFLYLRNKDGLGLGDVKFLAAAGVWLADAANFVPFLFFSGLLGIVSAIVWRMAGLGERFPFGPALAFSLLVCVLYPPAADGFWQLYGLLR